MWSFVQLVLSRVSWPPMLIAIVFAPPVIAHDGLEISIEVEATRDGTPVIELDKHFGIVFTNNSDEEIRIWHPKSRTGFYALTLESRNLTTGETFTSIRGQTDDDRHFRTSLENGDAGERFVSIAAGEEYRVKVRLLDHAMSDRAWQEIPHPNTGQKYSIRASYQVATANEAGATVWAGDIKSEPIESFVSSELLDTPHEYLAYNLADLAIKVMKEDRSWIRRRDEDQCMPLHAAASAGRLEAVRWLLDNEADVNAKAYNGFAPLHLTRDPEVIRLILEYEPDLNIKCAIQGMTPLQRAVENLSRARSEEDRTLWNSIVELYLAAGANYDIITAIYLDDLDRVKTLAGNEFELDTGFFSTNPLRRAVSLGRLKICEFLIKEHGIDVNQFEQGGGYPIIVSALAYPEVVRLLIDSGADLETPITWKGGRSGVWIIGDDATALHFAAQKGAPETVEMLIDAGIDIFATTTDTFSDQEKEQTALDVAAFFGKSANAEAIVNHEKFWEGDDDRRQKVLDRCLILAAYSSWLANNPDRTELLEVLLNKGANANATGPRGETAIQVAASQIRLSEDEENRLHGERVFTLVRFGGVLDLFSAVAIGDHEAVTRQLQQRPEHVNARRYDGFPALQFAVHMNDVNMVRLLLNAGADADIRNTNQSEDEEDVTPLHVAAGDKRMDIARLLVASGADVNAPDEGRATPLHHAANTGNIEMVLWLIQNGANVDAEDDQGLRPEGWSKSDEVINAIRKHRND